MAILLFMVLVDQNMFLRTYQRQWIFHFMRYVIIFYYNNCLKNGIRCLLIYLYSFLLKAVDKITRNPVLATSCHLWL